MSFIEDETIHKIPTMLEAIRLCMHRSGYTTKFVAEYLGIDQGHMSRIMSGNAHFPDNKYRDLMGLCGNYAPLQWLAMKCGFELTRVDERQKRIQEKKKEIALMRKELDDLEANYG